MIHKDGSEIRPFSDKDDDVEMVSELVSELVDGICKVDGERCNDSFQGLDIEKSKCEIDQNNMEDCAQAELKENKMDTTEQSHNVGEEPKAPSTENLEEQEKYTDASSEVIEKAKQMFLQSYKEVFTHSFNAIECLEPVVAEHVKKSYEDEKKIFENVQGNLENGSVKEIFLFHGTNIESINGILESNFDIQASPCGGGKAMVLGKGVYFSEKVSTCFSYGNSILLCKVLPGRVQVKDRKSCRNWETIPSAWNSRKVNHVFVIPNSKQILPFCIINCLSFFDNKNLTKLPPRLRDHSSHTAFLIKNELEKIYKDPIPGIFVATEKNDTFFKIHALVTGGFDTVYEGGLFHFQLYLPPEYPFR